MRTSEIVREVHVAVAIQQCLQPSHAAFQARESLELGEDSLFMERWNMHAEMRTNSIEMNVLPTTGRSTSSICIFMGTCVP